MRTTTALISLVTGLLVIGSSCDREDDSDGSSGDALSADAIVADAFLSAGAFNVTGATTPLEAADAEEKVQKQGVLRNHSSASEAPTPADPDNACAVVQDEVVIAGNTLTVRYRSDTSLCPRPAGAKTSLDMKMKVFAQVTCSTSDLSAFQGQTAAMLVERDAWHFCQNDPEESVIVNVAVNASYTTEEKSTKITAFGGLMNRDFGPCRFTLQDDRRAVDGCTMRVLGMRDGETYANEAYELQGVSGQAAAVYFDSGKAEVTINDWLGAVTFSTTSNPIYELGNGTETLSGTIGDIESFELNPRTAMEHLTSGVIARFTP